MKRGLSQADLNAVRRGMGAALRLIQIFPSSVMYITLS